MKKNISTLLTLLVAVVVTSCGGRGNNSEENNNQIIDHHTSNISLDWAGTYHGVLPCADCEGIETQLTINLDSTFTLISSYLGKEQPLSDTLKGTFSWEGGNHIKLVGITEGERTLLYKVEENQLRHLTLDDQIITSELEEDYILKKR